MTTPDNKMYEKVRIKATKTYYRFLADDEPVDNDEEFTEEIIYVEQFGNDETTIELTTQTSLAKKRDTQHAKSTAARTAAATQNPATTATLKKEPTVEVVVRTTAAAPARTTAAAAATTRAPMNLEPAAKQTVERTMAATEAPAKPAAKEKKTINVLIAWAL